MSKMGHEGGESSEAVKYSKYEDSNNNIKEMGLKRKMRHVLKN